MNVTVRAYRQRDANALADIYYDTIHRVNARDYSTEQINAWAPLRDRDETKWASRFEETRPFVAELRDRIAGFAELESDGHIDCFYCHHHHQREGVGSALMAAILAVAQDRELSRLFAEVSVTAKPFFERFGFKAVRHEQVIIRGVSIKRTLMELAVRNYSSRYDKGAD